MHVLVYEHSNKASIVHEQIIQTSCKDDLFVASSLINMYVK
jgi:hypothetical protein